MWKNIKAPKPEIGKLAKKAKLLVPLSCCLAHAYTFWHHLSLHNHLLFPLQKLSPGYWMRYFLPLSPRKVWHILLFTAWKPCWESRIHFLSGGCGVAHPHSNWLLQSHVCFHNTPVPILHHSAWSQSLWQPVAFHSFMPQSPSSSCNLGLSHT